jgi:hypothetical protein
MTRTFGASRPRDNGRVKNAGRRDCGLVCSGRSKGDDSDSTLFGDSAGSWLSVADD